MPTLTVWIEGVSQTLELPVGTNLRQALLEAGISPYAQFTRKLNCGGNGICATCGVEILSSPPDAQHWHDKMAQRFRYPRLSCKIQVEQDLSIRIMTEKKVWGKRIPKKSKDVLNS